MQSSGNIPPATIPSKARYKLKTVTYIDRFLNLDLKRNSAIVGIKLNQPENFPANTILVQRVLTSIAKSSPDKLESVALALSSSYWGDGLDISDESIFKSILLKHMTEQEVSHHISQAATKEIKEALKSTTQEAIAAGYS
jgi:2-hydroxychromene-2-carboxylate isomerase